MASTAAGDEFDSWLIVKLQALNTDETVFSSYIKGILEGDETDDEKNESLDEILSEITESQIANLREEILERWQSVFRLKKREEEEAAQTKLEDVDERLVRLMESQAKPTIAVKNYSEEDRRLKEAILQQYGHVADQEEEEEGGELTAASGPSGPVAAQSSKGIEKNLNVDYVVQAEKERREKAKQDAINKKEKDKEDREKQKQMQQDKKEKRKTQKGERRR